LSRDIKVKNYPWFSTWLTHLICCDVTTIINLTKLV
jgi:hypothetical protein